MVVWIRGRDFGMLQVPEYEEGAFDCRVGCCVLQLRMNRSGRGPFIHEIFEMRRLPVEQRWDLLPVCQARFSKSEDCPMRNVAFCCPFAR